MSQDKVLSRRIEIATIIKIEIVRAIKQGRLELEQAGELSSEIASKLKQMDNIEALNLEFGKIIKKYSILSNLGIKLDELKKKDLDSEISALVQDLVEKGNFDKALSLGNQVLSVYIRNPDINLDDFRLELLKKEHALTTKKSTKMHKTVEQKQQTGTTSVKEVSVAKPQASVVHTGPVEEGQILQEGEVFSEPGKEEFHDPAEDLKVPGIDAAKLTEKKEKLKETTKQVTSVFKESAGEVGSETSRKLKDAAVSLLAKVQEKFGKKEE